VGKKEFIKELSPDGEDRLRRRDKTIDFNP
jgi:hypothetical protein